MGIAAGGAKVAAGRAKVAMAPPLPATMAPRRDWTTPVKLFTAASIVASFEFDVATAASIVASFEFVVASSDRRASLSLSSV